MDAYTYEENLFNLFFWFFLSSRLERLEAKQFMTVIVMPFFVNESKYFHTVMLYVSASQPFLVNSCGDLVLYLLS